jgi:hypothetical protein
MIATREVIDRLCDAGMHPADAAVLLAKALAEMATKSPGARRQAAYRERHKASQSDVPLRPTAPSQSVTNRNEVTLCDAPLSKKERKKEEREPRARARASQLPEGWHPGEKAWQAAEARLGVRAVGELEKFKNHAADKGRVSKNWDAAFRNWVDRALDYVMGSPRGTPNGRPTIQDAAREQTRQLQLIAELNEPAPPGLCEPAGPGALRVISAR